MFDINTMQWSKELCGVLGIDTKMMPEIVKPSDIVGKITSFLTEKADGVHLHFELHKKGKIHIWNNLSE